MKIHNIEQRTDAWHELRLWKITGTVLSDILGTPKARETAFYKLLAERLSTEASQDENPMARGTRLEDEALEAYEKLSWNKVEKVGFTERDDNKFIASSPDWLLPDEKKVYSWAIEIKCLSSANHIKAFLKQEIPKEHDEQTIQYFVVNDALEYLHFVFYDPRISIKPIFYITVRREDIEEKIQRAYKEELEFLSEIDEALLKLL